MPETTLPASQKAPG